MANIHILSNILDKIKTTINFIEYTRHLLLKVDICTNSENVGTEPVEAT